MGLSELERGVFEEFEKKHFDMFLSRLIDQLMRATTGGAWTASGDGVAFAVEDWQPNCFVGRGIAWLLSEHDVQPIKANLEFDSGSKALSGGTIKFGSCSFPKSLKRDKVDNRFLANPDFEFDWMRVFVRNQDGWSAAAPALSFGE
jgi:hypothetical protein